MNKRYERKIEISYQPCKNVMICYNKTSIINKAKDIEEGFFVLLYSLL